MMMILPRRRPVLSLSRRLLSHLIPGSPRSIPDSAHTSGGLYDFMQKTGKWCELEASHAALVCLAAETPRVITYAELPRRVSAAAHALKSMGFSQGDVVNIHLHNCEQFVVGYLAVAALGGTTTTSNPAYTGTELGMQQVDSGAKFVLSSRQYADAVSHAVSASGAASVSYIEDEACFANAPSTDAPLPPLERPLDPGVDLLTVPYSSGTTGKPKGVMLSHLNVSVNILQLMVHIEGSGPQMKKEDYVMGLLPLFHIYGMVVPFLTALCSQSTVVLLPKFEPVSFLEAMQKYNVNHGHFVPPIILFLAKHPVAKKYKLSSLRSICSAAAPLDANTQKSLSEELGVPITQGWGMTELAPVATIDRGGPPTPGSAGTLLPGTVGKVIDPNTLEALPAGQPGELCIAGPQVMLGYLNRPDATEQTIMPDGFLRTGDNAYFDEAGHVYILDRLKELIKVKGLQVAPAELEGRLLELAEIVDAAVIGVPDERSGQLPKAFVVKKAGSQLDADQIKAALAKTLAEYKVPAYIEFVDSIPKSPSGKILRRTLK